MHLELTKAIPRKRRAFGIDYSARRILVERKDRGLVHLCQTEMRGTRCRERPNESPAVRMKHRERPQIPIGG